MKTRKSRAFPVPCILAFAVSCAAPLARNEATLRLSLDVPASSRNASSPRTIPQVLDGIQLQLVDGTDVTFQARRSALPGSTVSMSARVPAGTFQVQIFAVQGDVITGIALRNDVILPPNETTTLSLSMSPLTFSEPAIQSSIGPGDPAPQSVARSLGGIPAGFEPFLSAGTVRLRGKIGSLPAAWNDAGIDLSASGTFPESNYVLFADVPAGTALGNERLYYWFAVTWPGSSAVLSDTLPVSDASYLYYDGATLMGNLAGWGSGDSTYVNEANATAGLNVGGPALYNTSTDGIGNYRFGSVPANIYNVTFDMNDPIEWTTYIYGAQRNLEGGGWTNTDMTSSIPNITFSGLTLGSGTITTVDFRFQGY